MNDFSSHWHAMVKKAAKKLPKSHVLAFFRKTEILSYEKEIVTIGIPRESFRPWIEDNAGDILLVAAREEFPQVKILHFEIDGSLEETSSFDPRNILEGGKMEEKKQKKGISVAAAKKVISSRQIGFSRRFLNPNLTFEHFVNGDNTALAEAASLAVSREPGKKYNPLFLFGSFGLGKTHLLHAIGNKIAETFSDASIVLLSAQTFSDEIVKAIRSGKGDELREKYRRNDVFILDDVQFLSGKERTQEILFHTFNDLFHKGKQIVFSSDCPPNALQGIEERLVSRFSMGMVVDIQKPDFETRLAILQEKTEEAGVDFSDEVLEMIAEEVTESVRDLLGVFQQLVAHHELQGMRPNKTNLLRILKQRSRDQRFEQDEIEEKRSGKAQTIEDIAKLVANFYEVPLEKMQGSTRLREYNLPRQVAMFFAHRRMGESLQKVGNFFGGRDHTSVLSAVRRVEKNRKLSKTFWRETNEIRKQLGF